MSWILRDEESLLGREKGRAHQAVQRCVIPSGNCKWWERVRRWSRMDMFIHSFSPWRFPAHLLWAVPWGNQEDRHKCKRHRAHPERAQGLSSFRQKTPKAELYLRRGRLEEGRQMILSVFVIFHSLVAYSLHLLSVYPVPGGMIDSWQTKLFQWNFTPTL